MSNTRRPQSPENPTRSGMPVSRVSSERFGIYLVRRRIGEGATGEVFAADAVHPSGERTEVALKMMRPQVPASWFTNEAGLMKALRHENLVEWIEVGTSVGRPYIAMEYMAGGTLRELLRIHQREHLPLPLDISLHIVIEVLKGLAHLHNAPSDSGTSLGLVHCDVSPSNIFFSGDGRVKLGDFGLTRSSPSGPGPLPSAGTLFYVSPEQIAQERISSRSDLFALGVVCHEMLLGRHPVQGARDAQAVMKALRTANFDPGPSVDRALARILARSVAREPRARYQTAGEFAGALLEYVLDRNLWTSREQLQTWLMETTGLLP